VFIALSTGELREGMTERIALVPSHRSPARSIEPNRVRVSLM
jgi:hypothetical protein